jgi:hypothetical protein
LKEHKERAKKQATTFTEKAKEQATTLKEQKEQAKEEATTIKEKAKQQATTIKQQAKEQAAALKVQAKEQAAAMKEQAKAAQLKIRLRNLETKVLRRSNAKLKKRNRNGREERNRLKEDKRNLHHTSLSLREIRDLIVGAGGVNRLTLFDDGWHGRYPNAAKLLFGFKWWDKTKAHIALGMPELKDFFDQAFLGTRSID